MATSLAESVALCSVRTPAIDFFAIIAARTAVRGELTAKTPVISPTGVLKKDHVVKDTHTLS